MDISLSQFQRLASKASASRDIVLTNGGTDIRTKFFHSKSSNADSAATNRATMESFKTALTQTYGVFGEGAFQAVLKERMNNSQSLRAKDILATIRLVEQSLGKTQHAMVLQARYALGAAFKLVPAYNTLPEGLKAEVGEGTLRLFRDELAQDKDGSALQTLTKMMEANPLALEEKLAALMHKAVATLPELAGAKGVENLKPWTKTHTEIFLLNLRDPATQEAVSQKFAVVVEKARAQAPLDPMVKQWDKLHTQSGNWTSKEEFLEFASDWAERLSVKESVEADKALAKALKEPSSTLSQEVKERFIKALTPPVESPEVKAAHIELTTAKREFALAEAKMVLAQAKFALLETETRVEGAKDWAQTEKKYLQERSRILVENGDGSEVPSVYYKKEFTALEEIEKKAEKAQEMGERLRTMLAPLIDQAEKRIAHLEKGEALDAESLDAHPLEKITQELKALREFQKADEENVIFGKKENKLREEAIDLEWMRCSCAKEKRLLLEQQAKTSLTELRATRDALEQAAVNDPSLKTLSTVAKELTEAKQARLAEVESKTAQAGSHTLDFARAKDKFTDSDPFESWEDKEHRIKTSIIEAREANDKHFEALKAAESLTESMAITPNDVFASPTLMTEVKTHRFIDIRKAMKA